MSKTSVPFWAVTTTAFLAGCLPRWLTEGIFLDGLLYGAISRNLAGGLGSLWKPFLSATMTPDFFSDHPPLVFGIQSLFFRIFGDRILVENVYSFFTAAVTAALIVALWKRLTTAFRGLLDLAWLPVFFWATVPIVTWSYSYNMLENTLSIFVLATSLVLIHGLTTKKNMYLHVTVAAALICAGLLSKGIVALFPLSTIGFYWLFCRGISVRSVWGFTALLLALVAAIMGALLLVDDISYNLSKYVEKQFLPSLQGERGSLPNRFGVLEKLMSELAPMIVISVIVLVVNKFRRHAGVLGSPTTRLAAVFIAIGLSGSVPLVFSPRQSGFYLVPSFPFFALGFSLLIGPVVNNWIARIGIRSLGFKIFATVSAVALLAVVGSSIAQIGKVRRDETLIHDVKLIGTIVPANSAVTICESMWTHWSVHGYFARYNHMSLDTSPAPHEFAIMRDTNCASVDIASYERVELDTREFHLYRKVSRSPHQARPHDR